VIDKPALLSALRARIAEDLTALKRRQKDIQDGATHEESRSEHAKDTRATEQSYLARGLAERVLDLTRTAKALDALELADLAEGEEIAVGALVEITADETDSSANVDPYETCFIVPGAGGIKLIHAGRRLRTVTPVSPLGRALLGLCAGDQSVFSTPGGKRSFEIVSVH
jgi:transcription elongation GreA/GreB family factor